MVFTSKHGLDIYPIPDDHKVVFEEKPDMKCFSGSEKKVVNKILENQKVEMGDYLKQYLSTDGKHYKTGHFGTYSPSEKYQYSNAASTLAAHLVEVASGLSFAEFCQKNIIEPLEMKNAAFNISNPDPSKNAKQYFGKKQKEVPLYSHNFYPTGGLRISNDDLNLFLIETPPTPTEDDEAVLIINETSGGNCELTALISNIACDDNNTPNIATDDIFSFDLTVTGQNTSGNWTTILPSVNGLPPTVVTEPYGTTITPAYNIQQVNDFLEASLI